jgi:hypothetical protein
MIASVGRVPSYSPAVQHRGATVDVSSTVGDIMIKISSYAVATAVAAFLLAGSASAQTAAPAAKPMAPATEAMKPAPKPKAARTAASLECSKQADAKGLHGKERKKFRAACKKNGAAKAN